MLDHLGTRLFLQKMILESICGKNGCKMKYRTKGDACQSISFLVRKGMDPVQDLPMGYQLFLTLLSGLIIWAAGVIFMRKGRVHGRKELTFSS